MQIACLGVSVLSLASVFYAASPAEDPGAASGGKLLIGWASKDVTPARPVALAGQFHVRISKYVNDPITATALAIESAGENVVEEQAIMVSCDLVGIEQEIQARLRDMVKLELPEFDTSKLFLNATHTHTGPVTALCTSEGCAAMFSRSERNRKIETLEAMFGGAIGIYLTDINRIDVAKMTQLRAEFRKQGLQYLVVKNTLAKIALERSGRTDIMPFIEGPVGIAFANEEATAPARVIRDFQKANKELLEVKAMYVEGAVLPGSDCSRLADIPSREVLLSQLLGCLKAPMQKVAGGLNGILVKFAGTLEAVRAKKESEGE